MEKKERKDAVIIARIPNTLKNAIKHRAKELDVKISELIRMATEKFLNK